jgi:hypothetical protein
LVDHGQEIGRKSLQVDLVAKSKAERFNGLGGVVLAAVEAPVHDLLDAATGRLEQRGHS